MSGTVTWEQFLERMTPARWRVKISGRGGRTDRRERIFNWPADKDLSALIARKGMPADRYLAQPFLGCKGAAARREREHIGFERSERAPNTYIEVTEEMAEDPPAEGEPDGYVYPSSDAARQKAIRDAKRFEAEALKHELEVEKARRELAAVRGGAQTSDDRLAAAIEALGRGRDQPSKTMELLLTLGIPIVGKMLERIWSNTREEKRQLQELLERALERGDTEETPEAQRALSTVQGTLETIASLREVLEEMSGDSAPRDPMDRALSYIVKVLERGRGEAPAPQPPAQASAPHQVGEQQPAQTAAGRPEENGAAEAQRQAMIQRVVFVFTNIVQECKADTDPASVAEELAHPFGMLPGPVRTAILQARSVPSHAVELLQGIVPQPMVDELRALVATPQGERWIGTLLAELAAEFDEDHEGDPEEVQPGEDGTRYARPGGVATPP